METYFANGHNIEHFITSKTMIAWVGRVLISYSYYRKA